MIPTINVKIKDVWMRKVERQKKKNVNFRKIQLRK